LRLVWRPARAGILLVIQYELTSGSGIPSISMCRW